MTVPDWLLLDIIAAQAAALALVWGVVLVHGALAARRRARQPVLSEARRVIVRGLLDGSLDGSELEKLQRLPRGERIRLLNRVTPNLRGREREWLGWLAEELGLVDYGRRLIRSRFWWRRLRGARLLTLAGGSGDAVLRLAGDPHPLVRTQVAEWCGANPSEHAVATLVGMLGDPSQASRFAVQDALVRIAAAAVEPLARALRRSPGEPEILAALTVARGIGDSRLARPVLRLADHDSARVRAAAFRALGLAGGREAAERLERGLGDPDAGARAAAASSLGELAHWQAGPALARALGDTSWDVRAAAGRALLRIGPPGELLLRRVMKRGDGFAADMARHALDTAGVVTRFAAS
ncbi:MAG: HEAT repeat domain-containing protein [Gemmatimonadota bacterium]